MWAGEEDLGREEMFIGKRRGKNDKNEENFGEQSSACKYAQLS
jgi:hypothetical protein